MQIATEHPEPPVLLGILNGAVPFMMALLRTFPAQYGEGVDYDFVDASSYQGSESTGVVRVDRGPVIDMRGRPILVVDGIVDTGRTIAAVLEHLRPLAVTSVQVVTLLDKPSRRVEPVAIDYRGFEIEDHFVVGYGMDYNQQYRGLRYIGVFDS